MEAQQTGENAKFTSRGLLIAVESIGCTNLPVVCKVIASELTVSTMVMSFPRVDTDVGKLAEQFYNEHGVPRCPQERHLLNAADRRAAQPEIERAIASGTTVIVSDYAISGIARSVSNGMDMDTCKAIDRGLLMPDFTLWLTYSDMKKAKQPDTSDDDPYALTGERWVKHMTEIQDIMRNFLVEMFQLGRDWHSVVLDQSPNIQGDARRCLTVIRSLDTTKRSCNQIWRLWPDVAVKMN